jgi:O-antigen/teichoic acid export membrane protein
VARVFGFDLSTPGRSNIFALLDQGLVSFASFMATVLIARFCSQHELGVYTLGISVLLIVIEVQTAVVATPYMVFSPRADADELLHYSGSSLVIQLGLSTVAAISFAALAGALLLAGDTDGIAPVMLMLSCVAIPILLREYIRRVSFARLDAEAAIALDALVVVLQIGGLIVVAGAGLLSAVWAFLIAGTSCAIAATVWTAQNRRYFVFRASRVGSDFSMNWNFGKWVLGSGIMWSVGMSLYPWLLAVLHGTEAAGIWGACLGILAIGTIPMMGVQNYLGPQISTVYAAHGNEAVHAFANKAAVTFGAVLIPIAIVLAIFGDWLLTAVYSTSYSGHGSVVAVLAVNLVISAAAFCFSRTLFVRERADLDCWINVIPIVVLLTLGVWLTGVLGPLGAAFSMLLANIISAAARYMAMTFELRASLDR